MQDHTVVGLSVKFIRNWFHCIRNWFRLIFKSGFLNVGSDCILDMCGDNCPRGSTYSVNGYWSKKYQE